ncbi:MAG: sigma-70 family RNA polymerase sigma factor [Pirellulaceae bacterium]|jgi:RNA polymerase sigma-70 factor (ECF subfamily)|nr:sigma-70 family RNA polymerase sigma factor [Pirellulaceae bacterium]
MSDDLSIIERVLRGDRQEYRLLVERHQASLYRWIGAWISDPHDREDILQETFLAAFRQLESFDPARAAFFTWLATIARNKSFQFLRRKRPDSKAHLEPPPYESTPLDEAASAEFARRLDVALASLPAEQRTAFVLAIIQRAPLDEIAAMEEAPVGTIKSRVHRAKARLREELGVSAENWT